MKSSYCEIDYKAWRIQWTHFWDLQKVSRLEQLAAKYGVTIKWCPKFHCELNVIEGLWCSQKLYVRRKTDQTYNTMLKLIIESRENFREKDISMKLLRRFWRCLQAYTDGQTYAEVMQMFFSTICDGKVQNHTRISNSNLDIQFDFEAMILCFLLLIVILIVQKAREYIRS